MVRLLEFRVAGQKIGKKPGCDFSRIVAGSVNYLEAKFHFSDEWNGNVKVAVFVDSNGIEYPALLDEGDHCTIPHEALTGKTFKVYTICAKDGKPKIRSGSMTVKQEVY